MCSSFYSICKESQSWRPSEAWPIHILYETKGKCYQNTNQTPAVAEEFACIQAAKFLLLGEDGTDILPDDEAIFADEFISDGDTRGAKKLIARQADLIGDVAHGVAEPFPDFGHFIKCISNAFFKVRETESTYRGVGLLESTRIKAISLDVSRLLHSLHKRLTTNRDGLPQADKQEAIQRCLDGIYAIVPHHCGDHSHCSANDCRFKQIKHHLEAQKHTTDEDWTMDDIKELYAETAHFRGKTMSISKQGRKSLRT